MHGWYLRAAPAQTGEYDLNAMPAPGARSSRRTNSAVTFSKALARTTINIAAMAGRRSVANYVIGQLSFGARGERGRFPPRTLDV
jgi:hypothetical protein